MKEPETKTVRPALKTDILEMMDMIATFSEILNHETKALQASDYAAVDRLQPEKKLLARRYNDKVQALSTRKGEMMSLDLPTREKLVRARVQFTLLLADNMQALEAARNSAGRLVDRILETARQTVMDEKRTHYSSKGMSGAYKSATASLSMNEQL